MLLANKTTKDITLKKLLYILPLLFVGVFWSCKDEDVLSKSEMEQILYEMHLAQAVVDYSDGDRGVNDLSYRLAVIRKHGLTEAEWDSSFCYYSRHTEELYEIYQNLQQRLANDVILAGGDVADFENGIAGGDATEIWNRERNFILMPYTPYNTYSFGIDADSTYSAGDKFIIRYNANFLVQSGMRDVVLVTALRLANDSVISRVNHCSQSTLSELSIEDTDRKGIKGISGYFMLAQNLSKDDATGYRVVAIDNVQLIRLHTDDTAYKERLRNDSIAKARQDSIKAATVVTEDNTSDVNAGSQILRQNFQSQ